MRVRPHLNHSLRILLRNGGADSGLLLLVRHEVTTENVVVLDFWSIERLLDNSLEMFGIWWGLNFLGLNVLSVGENFIYGSRDTLVGKILVQHEMLVRLLFRCFRGILTLVLHGVNDIHSSEVDPSFCLGAKLGQPQIGQ